MAILGIVADDDDDGNAASRPARAPQQRALRKTAAQEQVAQGPEPWAEQAAPQQDSRGNITDPQLKMLHVLFGKWGMDRDGALAYCSETVGVPVESTKHLSKDEASRIIDALSKEENRG
jgi:hypothetical protein